MGFGSVGGDLHDQHILGAGLGLYNEWSYSCKSSPVYVHAIKESWSVHTATYPGPKLGPKLATKSFAHGWRYPGASSYSCKPKWEVIDLGSAGRKLVQGWARGTTPDYGLAVTASGSSRYGWKRFTSRQSSGGAPFLDVTYSPYGAQYTLPKNQDDLVVTYPTPTRDGVFRIKVTNRGSVTWSANSTDYRLGYMLYNNKTKESTIGSSFTRMPSDVGPNQSVWVNADLEHLPAGDYTIRWVMWHDGHPFTHYGDGDQPMRLVISDQGPTVTGVYPPMGFRSPTLTPQLSVTSYDASQTSIDYTFEICDGTPDDPGDTCVSSGKIAQGYWTVPAGELAWSKSYVWSATVDDGANPVTIGPVLLVPQVPQPVVTSHLSSGGDAGKAFDPEVGNYTTNAVDAAVNTAGPPLEVRRTYNSLDPRGGLAFGAGWATRFDMRLVPDTDDSGNVVVTRADGREVRFGRNPDGSYAAPQGDPATLAHNEDGTWTLRDGPATRYDFDTAGRLVEVTDASARSQHVDYDDSGHVTTVRDLASGRSLHFAWSGAHVSSVKTDPVDGKALTWSYTYDGDKLTQVCNPTGGCTRYAYGDASRYRTAVLDSAPRSYYRFGDPGGADAHSEVLANVDEDKGTYTHVTHGQAGSGALAGTDDSAAVFNGTDSSIRLPDRADPGPDLPERRTVVQDHLLRRAHRPPGQAVLGGFLVAPSTRSLRR